MYVYTRRDRARRTRAVPSTGGERLDSTKIAFEKASGELSQANCNMQTSSEELSLPEIKRS